MIRRADAEDAELVGEVLGAGFADDPLMRWTFADGGAPATAAMFAFLAAEVHVALGATFLDGDRGAVVWTPPDPPEWPPDRGARFAAALRTSASDADMDRLGALSAVMDEHRPTERHWYLSAVACVPTQRGKGVGTALLAHSIAQVDADRLPAYLESSNPRNVPLYERFGFRTTGVVRVRDESPPIQLMWRDAR